MKLKLTSLTAVGRQEICLYGLDEDGQVWAKIGDRAWEPVNMSAEACPRCKLPKNQRKLISKADGHGGLNQYCNHEFHDG